MPVSLTTLTGPIYMPNGATPVGGRVSFELSSWDREEGEALIVSGPIYSNIDENGQFSVELFTTTEGVNTVNYKMYVLWEDSELTQSYVNDVYVNFPTPHYTKKYIGSFALAGAGPFQVSDLNIVSELELNSFDVLLECQAYAVAAAAARNLSQGYAQTAEDMAVPGGVGFSSLHYAAKAANGVVLAQTAASNAQASATEAELTLADVLDFTETQMRSVSEFSSLDAFESYRSAFDYWRVGSLVNVGDMTLQKRASDGGTIWVRVDQEADKLINSYLEDVAGSVEPRHLASIPAMSLLGNALVRQGRPRGVPYEEFLYNIGHRWYGDTASGGLNFPRSGVLPNAANAMRSGRGTSTAGETTVTFHTPFAPCIPNVIITPKATNLADTPLIVTQIGDADPTGFKLVIKNSAGAAIARGFSYIATGNGDY